MEIPNDYDPVVQEESRQKRWDDLMEKLPVCTLCKRRLYLGDTFHTACYMIVCQSCVDELDENLHVVEVA